MSEKKFCTHAYNLYSLELAHILTFMKLVIEKFEEQVSITEKPTDSCVEKNRLSVDVFKKQQGLFKELIMCRAVDNYLTYLTQLITIVLQANPEMLKSSETITLQELLSHESLEQVIHHVVERKVNELSYKGIRDLYDYLKQRYGIDLFKDAEDLETTAKYVEMRNVITHNRGIINQQFIKRLKEKMDYIGQHVSVIEGNPMELIAHFLLRVLDLDSRVAEKFTLPLEELVDGKDILRWAKKSYTR